MTTRFPRESDAEGLRACVGTRTNPLCPYCIAYRRGVPDQRKAHTPSGSLISRLGVIKKEKRKEMQEKKEVEE